MARSLTATDVAVPRARQLAGPLSVGVLAIAAVTAIAVRDPHTAGSWGLCPLLAATGLYCPGCGGLRAVHDLAHLHPLAAISSNAMVVAFVAVAVIGWCAWLWSVISRRSIAIDRVIAPRRVYLVVVLIGLFTLARNLPVGAVLAP